MVFFPLVIAPTIFKILNEEQAGKILRTFFPKYYFYGIFLSIIGLVFSFLEENHIAIYTFIFLGVMFIFSRQVLMPAINKAKDNFSINDDIARMQFKKLHFTSVIINIIQLIFCFCLALNLIFFNVLF